MDFGQSKTLGDIKGNKEENLAIQRINKSLPLLSLAGVVCLLFYAVMKLTSSKKNIELIFKGFRNVGLNALNLQQLEYFNAMKIYRVNIR
ncbi:CLUMA_CG011746, isoform A [Clunio marinus]|uniref:CLUMA_CG011746, isoform A n=1 Tax=Clunio marinus TaxID=568069 RepID=A0A1J1IDU2_9DIPT|nr:CLUMA_CG011746, isoform A [Clunio marinus]